MARLSLLLKDFIRNESGVIHAAGYLLIVTIISIGMLAGLSTVRIHLVQTLADTAVSLERLDQSYSFAVGASTSVFADSVTATDAAGVEPAGISVQEAAASEQ